MAVTLTAAALKLKLGLAATTQDEADAGLDPASDLLAVASALVSGYAANAPDAISNEAVFRLSGWLHSRGAAAPDTIRISRLTLGWRDRGSKNALRLSGAMSLLAGWHRPRATVIE